MDGTTSARTGMKLHRKTSGEERRQGQRLKATPSLNLAVVRNRWQAWFGKPTLTGEGCDLSTHGMQLAVNTTLQINDRLKIWIRVDHKGKGVTLVLYGTVMWMRPADTGTVAGIALKSPSARQQQIWEEAVFEKIRLAHPVA
jgi:hypothetical protein